jgi:hypothetical protein
MFTSMMSLIAEYEHDSKAVDGKKVHNHTCRRCQPLRQTNGLRQELQSFMRRIGEEIGNTPDNMR